MTSPCILLIDDHAILLDGLRMLLEARLTGAKIVTASSLGDAIQVAESPDMIVLDIKMPGVNGLEGLASLHRKWPQARIVMLSSQDDNNTRQEALTRGAAVFISKTEAGERVGDVICQLLQGEAQTAMPDNLTSKTQQYLTPRQCEVLDLLNQGLTNKMIAKKLSLSDNTVRRHVQDIFAFFSVTSRTEAVFAARRQRIVL